MCRYANSLPNIEEALERIRTVSRRWASGMAVT